MGMVGIPERPRNAQQLLRDLKITYPTGVIDFMHKYVGKFNWAGINSVDIRV